MDAFLREQLDAVGIPGAAIAVVRDGVPVHSAALGRADDSGRPMTARTPVLLASTSKSLTAITLMQQVGPGRLRLDEPVQTYLLAVVRPEKVAALVLVTSPLSLRGPAFADEVDRLTDRLDEGWVRDSLYVFQEPA